MVGYDDPYKAEEVRLKLRKLQSEYLLDLEDAVVLLATNHKTVEVKVAPIECDLEQIVQRGDAAVAAHVPDAAKWAG